MVVLQVQMEADEGVVEIPPPIHLLKKQKRAILHDVIDIHNDDDFDDSVIIGEKVGKSDVIDIHDDDDYDDLVIIGEKVGKSNKTKTIEAIHQVVPGIEYDLSLKNSTFKNSPWYDTQSDAKNSHVTDSSRPSWALEPNNSKIQGSTRGSSNLQIKMDNVDHSFGTELSSPQLFPQAAPSKKKSAASQRSGRGYNLALGVESSKSERLSKSFRGKMKSTRLAGNPEARKLLAATKFKSVKKAEGSSSSYHANFKDKILRKFRSFKQFDIVRDAVGHRFVSENSSMKKHTKNWAKKIQKEWKILEKGLPDSIFVRAYESRMDLLRAVIIGEEGTPYHDGLFFLDLYFPCDYPNVPPLVYFETPYHELNPNVDGSGNVCLSLLNTWGGNGSEYCWVPRVSTILQVLVSMQGLVLNAKPFFNGPFCDGMRGSTLGESSSLQYNENTCIHSLLTMVYRIRWPPKNFEDFVVGHFISRAHDILGACKAYMEGAQVGSLVKGGVQDVDEGDKSCTEKFKNSLREPMEELVREFARIGAKDCEKFLCYKRKEHSP